ncbi:hypothetical protein QJS10_CPA03g00449 [Acorus calamus]|uniref:Uncharacterized protein n=1 Tax=Acorus calamus TaxID=4465 RepID=A0AAV9F6H1_ACOCL|nr:hypothetical protein QJS10_CPA03g00449 [Acorus calamus]
MVRMLLRRPRRRSMRLRRPGKGSVSEARDDVAPGQVGEGGRRLLARGGGQAEVLADPGGLRRKRTLYDAGLYDPLDEAEDIDGFSGFVEMMMSLMEDVRREVR